MLIDCPRAIPLVRKLFRMVALAVETPEQVHRVYDKALALGATDEGPAGPRMAGFYAGYFRDLDGNKLNVFCFNPDAA